MHWKPKGQLPATLGWHCWGVRVISRMKGDWPGGQVSGLAGAPQQRAWRRRLE